MSSGVFLSGMSGMLFSPVPHVFHAYAEQMLHMLVVRGVEDLPSCAPETHQVGLPEHTEMWETEEGLMSTASARSPTHSSSAWIKVWRTITRVQSPRTLNSSAASAASGRPSAVSLTMAISAILSIVWTYEHMYID